MKGRFVLIVAIVVVLATPAFATNGTRLLLQAKDQVSGERYNAANRTIVELLDSFPTVASYRFEAAKLYLAMNRLQAAEDAFRVAIRQNSGYATEAGLLMLNRGQEARAIRLDASLREQVAQEYYEQGLAGDMSGFWKAINMVPSYREQVVEYYVGLANNNAQSGEEKLKHLFNAKEFNGGGLDEEIAEVYLDLALANPASDRGVKYLYRATQVLPREDTFDVELRYHELSYEAFGFEVIKGLSFSPGEQSRILDIRLYPGDTIHWTADDKVFVAMDGYQGDLSASLPAQARTSRITAKDCGKSGSTKLTLGPCRRHTKMVLAIERGPNAPVGKVSTIQ